MGIRDLRDRSRLALHRAMQVPAVFITADRQTYLDVTVRVHNRTQRFGDMTGFDYAPVERITPVPEIVCLASEADPKRGDIFIISATEGYEVETSMPQDGITNTAQVTLLKAAEIAPHPKPGDDLSGYPLPGP